jgi:hypothetical protein
MVGVLVVVVLLEVAMVSGWKDFQSILDLAQFISPSFGEFWRIST